MREYEVWTSLRTEPFVFEANGYKEDQAMLSVTFFAKETTEPPVAVFLGGVVHAIFDTAAVGVIR